MKAAVIHEAADRTFVLVFDKGDEVVGELSAFATRESLTGAHFTAIGAFSDVTLGFFDREQKDYRKIPVGEPVEVLSLLGDVALDGHDPRIHAHVVVGKRDGTAHGGPLIAAHVWPTLELILTESPRHLCRTTDRETGLGLTDLPHPVERQGKTVKVAVGSGRRPGGRQGRNRRQHGAGRDRQDAANTRRRWPPKV